MFHLCPQNMNVSFELFLMSWRWWSKRVLQINWFLVTRQHFMCGKVKTHNVRFWGTSNPKEMMTRLKLTFLLLYRHHECTAHFSSRRQMLLAFHTSICCNCGYTWTIGRWFVAHFPEIWGTALLSERCSPFCFSAMYFLLIRLDEVLTATIAFFHGHRSLLT